MPFNTRVNPVDALNIKGIFQGLSQLPMMEQKARQEAEFNNARTYAAQMTGDKYGAEAADKNLTVAQRNAALASASNESTPQYQRLADLAFGRAGAGQVKDYVGGLNVGQELAARDQIINAGGGGAAAVKDAYYATSTAAPYTVAGNTGRSANGLTGQGVIMDPTMAGNFDREVVAKIFKERAAGSKYHSDISVNRAQIGEIGARTAKTRQETEQGAKGTYDSKRGLIINQRTGEAIEVTKGGKPIGAGEASIVGYDQQGNAITSAPQVKLTEDQGKATAWLAQATNAFGNMKGAMESTPSAAKPGFNDAIAAIPSFGAGEVIANNLRGADRQKFMQASSSLSEALLRAATGAGVNRDEALQKIRELTPVFGEKDATTKQKMDSIPIYIESLKVRAGPGAPQVTGIFNRAGAPKPAAPAGPRPGNATPQPAAPTIKFLGFE